MRRDIWDVYFDENMNARYKNEVKGEPYAYRLNGEPIDCIDHRVEPIDLCDIHKYNEPLIIYDKYCYGWNVNNETVHCHGWCCARVVFPPFRDYTVIKEADDCGIGSYIFTSSNEVSLYSYILNNPYCNVEDFGYHNRIRINENIREYLWEYDYDSKRGSYFTNVETGEVVYGYRNLIKRIFYWRK